MPITNLQELFVHELCLIYDAEHQFVEGQQEMAQSATDQELESAIREHIEQTRLHIRNLEEVFDQLGQEPQRQTSVVAQGLVSKAQQNIQEAQNDAIRDCVIDAGVIKVEHFETGSYRGLVTGARQMGQTGSRTCSTRTCSRKRRRPGSPSRAPPNCCRRPSKRERSKKGW